MFEGLSIRNVINVNSSNITQSYCNMHPKCAKCTENHNTADCLHLERLTNPKCSNFGGGHTASFIQCPKLLSYLEFDDFKNLMHLNLNNNCNLQNMLDMMGGLKANLLAATSNLDRLNILLKYSEFFAIRLKILQLRKLINTT